MFRQSGSTLVETDRERLKELAKQEAANMAAAERNRILQDAARVNQQVQLTHIKRTPVTRNGKRVVLGDVQSNDSVLETLLNPGEEISVEWFLAHCQEPSFDRLAWEEWLSPKQRKTQDKANAEALRSRFSEVCRARRISEIDANFNIWSSVSNPVITELGGMLVVLDENGDEMELTPAPQEEQDKWQQERFQAHQNALKDAAVRNDVKTLRELSEQERQQPWLKVGPYAPQKSARQQQQERELIAQFERDVQAGYTTTLPQAFTAAVIRKWSAAEMQKFISRYGGSRITARLNGITSVYNDRGQEYRFE